MRPQLRNWAIPECTYDTRKDAWPEGGTVAIAILTYIMLFPLTTLTLKNQVQDLVHFDSVGVRFGILR